MKPTSEVTALVIDTGVFQHIARRVAREFNKVWYWSPWEIAFPRLKDDLICDGYDEVERVESIEEVKSQCDLFIFPDIGYADLQVELQESGKAVWGCRHADELEANRGKFLKVLATETDLPVPEHEKLKGVTNLRLFLKDKENYYIKVNTYRGDFETCKFRNMDSDEHLLDQWAVKLGPLKEEFVFYAFAHIDTEIEDGIDTYCIDGRWPNRVMHGMECKDSAFIGCFQNYDDVPEETRCANDAFGPILEKYGYRGAFSTEVRITKDKESFFIDPTCRFPSPPSQCQCEMIGNLGDIIWQGANGNLIEPDEVAQFGAQAIFKVDRDEWGVFEIPKELDPWVKIAFSCKHEGRICVPPDPQGVEEIGWVVGIGDTMEGAIESLREHKDAMPDGCHVQFQSLADLLKELQTASEAGMEMTDEEIPEPSTVIED